MSVTVAIPTYNRASYLRDCIKSVLAQTYDEFTILVLDNASTDETTTVVKQFNDSRIVYHRNKANIGLFRNWNKAITLNTSSYLTILQDDDWLEPDFLKQSTVSLDQHPSAALSFTQVQFVDFAGHRLEMQDNADLPDGLFLGLDYLHRIVSGENIAIQVTGSMMRASALTHIGSFDISHQTHAMEFNLHFRLAAQFDFVFIPHPLACIRQHEEQAHRVIGFSTAPIGMVADRIDAIAYLLQSGRAADESYIMWLADRILHINKLRSLYTAQHLPQLNLSYDERLLLLTEEIVGHIPVCSRFILIDDNAMGIESFDDRQHLPFLERDGEFWGAPPDSKTAIQEVERMRHTGASYLVFGWPAFWWYDHYSELRDYLHAHFECILSNSRLIIFDLCQLKSGAQ